MVFITDNGLSKRLWLQDFRNYSAQETVFKKGTNVVLGQNGQGKKTIRSNLLYGQRCFFRGAPAEALIQKGLTLRSFVLKYNMKIENF